MKRNHSINRVLAALLCVCSLGLPVSARAAAAPASTDVFSAAAAARFLRDFRSGAITVAARPDLDLTDNDIFTGGDARAMLMYTVGSIPDLKAFQARVSTGLCSERLMDRFSYTGVKTESNGGYRSENVSITVSSGEMGDSRYHLADICVQDLACLVTAFSQGEFGGSAATVQQMFDSIDGGLVAMNGDYYTQHYYGPVIRNGETYVDHVTRDWDLAVLLTSGELKTYDYRVLTKDALASMSVYQTWVFGPSLLDEAGHAKSKFRSAVQAANPRSVLGYYEPGHYAFLTVDGRTKESKGVTMQELSQLCEDLGFARAYNLDGGRSSVLIGVNGFINDPYRGGRTSSDIVAIRELPVVEPTPDPNPTAGD